MNRLQDNGYGCWIGDYFYGAISYADDLCILSPTIAGLQEMLNVCTNYGKEYDVMFNPKKTQCLKFSKNSSKDTNIYVKLSDQQLSWVNSFKYLGNWVSNTLSEDIEIDRKLGVFFGNVNNLKTTFRNIGRKNIFILFNSYCCHLYGSQAWRLRDKNISRMYTAWNKAVRHLSDIPYNTHTRFLPYIVDTLNIKEQIYIRSAKMIKSMLVSKYNSVRFLARSNVNNKLTIIGENWEIINCYVELNQSVNSAKAVLYDRFNKMFTVECHVLLELIDIIDGDKTVDGFSNHDITDILCDLCTY